MVFLGVNKEQFEDYVQKNSMIASLWDLQQEFKIRKKMDSRDRLEYEEFKGVFEIEAELDIIPNEEYVALMLR